MMTMHNAQEPEKKKCLAIAGLKASEHEPCQTNEWAKTFLLACIGCLEPTPSDKSFATWDMSWHAMGLEEVFIHSSAHPFPF